MPMTPETFLAWVGGGTALITGLIKGFQMLMTVLGVTPEDRRKTEAQRIEQCENRIEELEDTVEKQKLEIASLRTSLREEETKVAMMEGLFTRMGWRPDEDGNWGPPFRPSGGGR